MNARTNDVQLVVTFDPLAPGGCTAVESDLQWTLSPDEWLGLCLATAARLQLYAENYASAAALDQQAVLPGLEEIVRSEPALMTLWRDLGMAQDAAQ